MNSLRGFYSKLKKLFLVLNVIFTAIFLFIMAYSFSRPLREIVAQFTGNSIIVITVYFFLFYVLYFCFMFGLRFLDGFVLENHLNKKQKFKSWARELINKETITFAVLLVGVQVVYFFLETNISAWCIPMSLLSIVFFNAGEFLPNWGVPYYSRHRSLDDRGLQNRLQEIAQRAGLKFSNILVYADAKAKAIIFGIKDSRLLILSDAALEYAPEEIEVLVAMEIARLRDGYLWKNALKNCAGIVVTFLTVNLLFPLVCEKFGFEFTFDVETLPVLLCLGFIIFVIVWLVLNYFNRDRTKENDEYALRITRLPEAFVSLIIRESKQDIKTAKAIYFFEKILYAKVSTSQRLMLAQDYAQNMLFEQTSRNKKLDKK